jgi:hypothetical protein
LVFRSHVRWDNVLRKKTFEAFQSYRLRQVKMEPSRKCLLLLAIISVTGQRN